MPCLGGSDVKPRLLDLFCGAGGCSMGYHNAGFDVFGVDHLTQKNYPFPFVQCDALEYVMDHGHKYDVIHASPPCQAYSSLTRNKSIHPDMLQQTRNVILSTCRPYVIENVIGAPMRNAIVLCGTNFNLKFDRLSVLRRHRLFELSHLILVPQCACRGMVTAFVGGHMGRRRHTGKNHNQAGFDESMRAMGIHWMTRYELSQAVPPAYTEYIGRHLILALSLTEPNANATAISSYSQLPMCCH